MTTPRDLSAKRAIAADISWARTPNRAERTAPGHRASPLHIDYWIAKVRDEGIVTGEAEILKAAESYYRASQRLRSLKAAATRARKKEAQRARMAEPYRDAS